MMTADLITLADMVVVYIVFIAVVAWIWALTPNPFDRGDRHPWLRDGDQNEWKRWRP